MWETLKQPNGKYAIVSVYPGNYMDIVKHNLTKEECIDYILREAQDLEWYVKARRNKTRDIRLDIKEMGFNEDFDSFRKKIAVLPKSDDTYKDGCICPVCGKANHYPTERHFVCEKCGQLFDSEGLARRLGNIF